ncbi:3-phosphoglycerate dehydrogenase [Candidatus Bathyarchaeota archaeon]|nr:MAG: 3-phosphoglycerate dehydrogenase [Candidatus Bathyarchaeota archaeon]
MRVLVCDPVKNVGIEMLREAGFEVDVRPEITPDQLSRIIRNYDVLIVRSRTKVTRQLIERAERLKVIGRAGVGLDNIDVEAAEKRGITVLNTPEAPADSTAELTIGLILALARKIPSADKSMKEGRWLKGRLKGWQLKGKTIGLIGLGNIGLRVARLAKAFGMKILFTKRTPPSPEVLKELEAEFVPLEDLLRRSDVVSIHVPLTEETRGMIGERELSLIKEGAVLINTSRGAVVDEEALLNALQSGRLRGAALDVYTVEPPKDLRLIKLPNVVCTPHIGAQTDEAQVEASRLIAEKIIKCLLQQ